MNLSKLKDLFIFDTPFALTLEGWDKWQSDMKAQYPIKWFLFKSIPEFINSNIVYPLHNMIVQNLYWGFLHKFIPKYQYHIIKPDTLKFGYHDSCEQLIHANFHILKEFVDFESSDDGQVDWTGTIEHEEFWKEAQDLVNWWVNIYPYREEKMDEEYPFPSGPPRSNDSWMLYTEYDDTPEKIEWNRIHQLRMVEDDNNNKEDENNLIRLMKIRLFLWN